ncbi:hypothetical protein SUGI_0418200 [Cryptomeria japonica]|uniref:protein phosphatase 2C 51 n=1 Tax=Cryptomeria japonica TaxID=3369 RepID=UPI0024089397|nr:protein phosphatase 2C 51 [Cryptomeria japonica]XP_057823902.2 protein phosphatase 2C 51 [Cryptomeria japonica]GLJ22244.1 hypothetical protein SUGI_0418200 [Cryptomeria japonica]
MEEIAVAKAVGCRCRCLSECACEYGCQAKSRAARRRRMEIRQFKLVAANAAAISSGPSKKRAKLGHNGRRTSDEAADEREENPVTEKAARSVGSSQPWVLASRDRDVVSCPQHGVVSICGRRREMEDAVRVVPSFVAGADGVYHFFAVFDGHGGSQAALHCKERLHEALAEEIRLTDPVTATEWESVMKACFLKMDVEVAGLCGSGKQLDGRGFESQGHTETSEPSEARATETVGSTAVVAVVSSRQIVVANCGDSRAVLSTADNSVALSADHKPEGAEEMARIEAAGGRVIYWNGYRVLGVLAMSRAIGDKYLKPYVIAEPDLRVRERNAEEECLILASDGLWDVVSNDVACEVSRRCLAFHGRGGGRNSSYEHINGGDKADPPSESPAATAAALLTKLALARGSSDNISVIVVDLRKPR